MPKPITPEETQEAIARLRRGASARTVRAWWAISYPRMKAALLPLMPDFDAVITANRRWGSLQGQQPYLSAKRVAADTRIEARLPEIRGWLALGHSVTTMSRALHCNPQTLRRLMAAHGLTPAQRVYSAFNTSRSDVAQRSRRLDIFTHKPRDPTRATEVIIAEMRAELTWKIRGRDQFTPHELAALQQRVAGYVATGRCRVGQERNITANVE